MTVKKNNKKKGVSTATDAERRYYYHAGFRPAAHRRPVSMATGLKTPSDNGVSKPKATTRTRHTPALCVCISRNYCMCVRMYKTCVGIMIEKRPGTGNLLY